MLHRAEAWSCRCPIARPLRQHRRCRLKYGHTRPRDWLKYIVGEPGCRRKLKVSEATSRKTFEAVPAAAGSSLVPISAYAIKFTFEPRLGLSFETLRVGKVNDMNETW